MKPITVFKNEGCYFLSDTDKDRANVIGIELEVLYAPSTSKQREHTQILYPFLKESKPSLIQIRKGMRELKLHKMEWFITEAVADGFCDELVFAPLSKKLIYALKEDIQDMLLELMLNHYIDSSPVHDIGIHHNIELDFTTMEFYRFLQTMITVRNLILKVSNRVHLSTRRSDLEFSIGNAWGNMGEKEIMRRFQSQIEVLLDGFKKKVETTLLGLRIYPDGRPLLEIMLNGSTFDVDTFFTQIDLTYALKGFAKETEEISQENFLAYVVDYKYDLPYLFNFVINEVEEFSLTRILRDEVRIIT